MRQARTAPSRVGRGPDVYAPPQTRNASPFPQLPEPPWRARAQLSLRARSGFCLWHHEPWRRPQRVPPDVTIHAPAKIRRTSSRFFLDLSSPITLISPGRSPSPEPSRRQLRPPGVGVRSPRQRARAPASGTTVDPFFRRFDARDCSRTFLRRPACARTITAGSARLGRGTSGPTTTSPPYAPFHAPLPRDPGRRSRLTDRRSLTMLTGASVPQRRRSVRPVQHSTCPPGGSLPEAPVQLSPQRMSPTTPE